MTYQIHLGSNLDILPTLPDNSVDSIVTDPPYGLSDNKFVADTIAKWISGERDFIPDGKGFMGKSWDAFVPPPALWDECLRVLKPGGHLLAFFGSRTQDIGALSIRLAGFEIRDSIAWMYGSGFPKSLDISKAIDKRGGQGATLTKQIGEALKEARESRGISKTQADQMFCDGTTNWTWFEGRPAGQRPPTTQTFARIVAEWKELEPLAALVAEAEREVIGKKEWSNSANHFLPGENHTERVNLDITAPSTPEAQQWEGWGTALKPAFEPIVVARKPLIGTVAENVLTHGTGGLNIDGSRIGTQDNLGRPQGTAPQPTNWGKKTEETFITEGSPLGRWPANVILDPYTAELLDEQSGQSGTSTTKTGEYNSRSGFGGGHINIRHPDSGGASRFFYVADTQKQGIISVCKNTPASIVANYFKTIRATIESSAQTSVEDLPSEKLAQAVRSAGIQCDLCGMSIAHDIVALRSLAINKATSTHFQRYTKDCVNSTLTQNLVSLVEQWENIDIIPTMTSFGTLFGCVLLATDENTRLANLESDNDQTAFLYQAKASKRDRNEGLEELDNHQSLFASGSNLHLNGDGSPRNKDQATKNFHPTVKPTDLMRYLVKLVTPPGGVVLDPFTGSGSTGKAAILEGFRFIGCELTEDYIPIIEGRLAHAERLVAEQKEKEDEALF